MALLLMDQAAASVVVAFPWVDVATKLGVPTAMLAFMVWFYVRTQVQHGIIIREKDAEISRLNKEHDADVAKMVEKYSAELSRVNEQRVKEQQEMASVFQRDNARSMDLLNNTDKTLSLLLEKLR